MMTLFEQEISQAIAHGCPDCGNHSFEAIRSRCHYSRLVPTVGAIAHADRSESECLTWEFITCGQCHAILWAENWHQWDSELQKAIGEED